MRLLHTKYLEFREFFGNKTPQYAILSHRWSDHEVTFLDFPQYKQQDWGSKYAKSFWRRILWNFLIAIGRPSDSSKPGNLNLDKAVEEDVSQAARITIQDLRGNPEEQSIAKKMSWLSGRETSRIEDMAYCMLGLCGVNMPLLYGERERAFTRLQSEIIKSSDDESICAWFTRYEADREHTGILAVSPRASERSGQIELHAPMIGKRPFSMTNKGLQYQVPRPRQYWDSWPRIGEKYTLLLDCGVEQRSPVRNLESITEPESITINLVFGEKGWERLPNWEETVVKDRNGGPLYDICNHEPISHSSKRLWASVVDNGCLFETLYINAVGHSLGRERAAKVDNSSHEALPEYKRLVPE
ncbi:MAG: hypothetical protein Q9213_001829 [Squamulea squamosa]